MATICLLLVGSMIGMMFYIGHLHDRRDDLENQVAHVAKAGNTLAEWLKKNHPDIFKQMISDVTDSSDV